jgi:hypothetical protein
VKDARPGGWGITYRPATPLDIPACGEIWRDALNEYLGRLGQHPVGEDLAPIGRLHGHLLRTDPDGFRVATRGRRVIGFGASVLRGEVWFLSMLFVRPGEQGVGVGHAILDQILPADGATTLATATDSAQPVSNGLYAGLGIVPRMPLLSLVGRPSPGSPMPALPTGIVATPVAGAGNARGASEADLRAIDDLDLDVVGFAHRQDHEWLTSEGRRAFLYCGPDGSPVAYGYASAVGRVGPVAVRDRDLLAPVLGHLLAAIEPRGASAVWVPGATGSVVTALLQTGLRLEGFPVLFCWDRPFADFERYIPISPGLL